jgi:LEA14-like dessication related protein
MYRYRVMLFFLFLIIPTLTFSQKLELITPPVLDLGDVPADTIAEGIIEFKNAGDSTLKILRIQTSCGCTVADLNQMDYAKGEQGEIKVKLNTRGISGTTRKSITIYLENAEPSRVRVILQATVKANVEFNPLFIDFQGISLKDKEVVRYLDITNNTDKTMKIETIKSSVKNLKVDLPTNEIPAGGTIKVKFALHPKSEGRQDTDMIFDIVEPFILKKHIPVFVKIEP